MTDPKPITDAELAALRELEAKATPEMWIANERLVYALEEVRNCRDNLEQRNRINCWVQGPAPEHEKQANAALVVALRNAFHSLLARIEQQEREIEHQKQKHFEEGYDQAISEALIVLKVLKYTDAAEAIRKRLDRAALTPAGKGE